MLSKSKVKHLVALALAAPLMLAAKPVIDDAHDRVQTTLDPMMNRIGTLLPRSAKEIGPTRLAIGKDVFSQMVNGVALNFDIISANRKNFKCWEKGK